MEFIIVIAVIWGIFSMIGRATKHAAKQRQSQRGEAPVQPVREPARRMSVWDQVTEMMEDTLNMRPDEGEPEQQSAFEPRDYVAPSGSLDYHSHEGIHAIGSLEVEAPCETIHLPAQSPKQDKFGMTARPMRARARVGARGLKRAVILAEVLEKPLAIRND